MKAMGDVVLRYGSIFLAVLVGVGGLIAVFGRSRQRLRDNGRRSLLDYLLIWPLLFRNTGDKAERGGRVLTNREIVGWLVVIVLIVLAVTFNW
jgi:hypothetical protein